MSWRAKKDGLAGQTVVLKLKTTDFKIRSRRTPRWMTPRNLRPHISAALPCLSARRIQQIRALEVGIERRGLSNLSTAVAETKSLDARVETLTKAERAIDKLRRRIRAPRGGAQA